MAGAVIAYCGAGMKQIFEILGEVRGQGRPRATNRGEHAGMYKASVDRQYEGYIRAQIKNEMTEFIPAHVPIKLLIVFVILRPGTHYRKNGAVKPWAAAMWPTIRPDLDNAEKSLKDACNGLLWHDDKQVVCVEKRKIYGERGRIHLEVETL